MSASSPEALDWGHANVAHAPATQGALAEELIEQLRANIEDRKALVRLSMLIHDARPGDFDEAELDELRDLCIAAGRVQDLLLGLRRFKLGRTGS